MISNKGSFRQNVNLAEFKSSFNPIGHSEEMVSHRASPAKKKTVQNRLGSTAHIFNAEKSGPSWTSPAKKNPGKNEFQNTANVFAAEAPSPPQNLYAIR